MATDSAKESQSNQLDNLDLSQIDSADVDTLASCVETFYKSDSLIKAQLTYHWERNHLMLDGQQWIVFEGSRATGGLWKPVKISKENEYIPRPVTNYMYDAYQTLKSYMLKTKPRTSVRPNSQTHRDKSSAKIGELCLEANFERLKEDYNYEYAAACLITYGTVFKKDYWDYSNLVLSKIPVTQPMPVTDPQTGQVIGMEERAVTDENGQPVFQDVPLGDVNTAVVEPYRIALDPLATDLHTAKWIMEYSIQTLDWIKATYSREEEGYTNRADEVKPEAGLNNSMRRWFRLKTSSGTRNASPPLSGSGSGPGGHDAMVANSAVLKEYYERPCELYPKGRLVVVANNIPLYVGESPCEGDELGDWHPYSECRWEIVPGRFWGKSPLDDASEIQKMINSIDAVIILVRKTMAIPQKLIPLGAGIAPGSWTGRPGQEVFWRPNGSNNVPPSTIPASGVDQSIFAERAQRLEDFKQITGAIDILKGDRPNGVTAASALNMLYEVGTGKLFPILDRWKCYVESSQKKQLKIIAQKYREPRQDFIKLLKSKNSQFSEEELNKFIGTDLNDNCNVKIEAGSNVPKLQAAKQAMLMELAQGGTLQLESPINRQEFNDQMGITGFDSDVGKDIKRAEWENDLMDSLMENPEQTPVVLEVDNDDLHMQTHGDRMKEPSFMSLPIQIQQAYMMHNNAHQQAKAMKMQEMAITQMAAGMPPQATPPPGNAPQKLQPSGKGVSESIKNNIFSDAIVPGSRKG